MRRSLPWYMYPKLTCRVLNRIANKVTYEVCADIMEKCTMMLWSKQEAYYKKGVTV